MSKKAIGPALPPHLQHLDRSARAEEHPSSQFEDKSAKSSHSLTPKNVIVEDEDDEVLSLYASDEELSHMPPTVPETLQKLATQRIEMHKCSDEEDLIGPAFPVSSKKDLQFSESPNLSEDDAFGSALPRHLDSIPQKSPKKYSSDEEDTYGPVLPPNLKAVTQSPSKSESLSEEDDDSFAPALPPNFKGGSGGVKVIGPTLPSSLEYPDNEPLSDSDEDLVGPPPPMQDSSARPTFARQQLEERALKIKMKLTEKGDDDAALKQTRETWMLELPPDRAAEFGLGPRQFRARAKLDPGDRSVWTDTPSDKERKANDPDQGKATTSIDLKTEMEMKATAERDQAMQNLTDKHNKKKKRKESLVELHQKKLKKKQKKDEEDGKFTERRPFDRNLDLQANRFDDAQKKAILRKAQFLDDRFSRGESKFL